MPRQSTQIGSWRAASEAQSPIATATPLTALRTHDITRSILIPQPHDVEMYSYRSADVNTRMRIQMRYLIRLYTVWRRAQVARGVPTTSRRKSSAARRDHMLEVHTLFGHCRWPGSMRATFATCSWNCDHSTTACANFAVDIPPIGTVVTVHRGMSATPPRVQWPCAALLTPAPH